MANQRILYSEEMVGDNHPTKTDTLNRHGMIEHNEAGKHNVAAVATLQALGLGIPIGTMLAFATETVPSGYLECDGSSVLRAIYAALFTKIGTNWGTADGTHFNLPDLRGKFLRGWDHAATNDPNAATRTAQATGGETGDHVGTIQADELKAHTHTVQLVNRMILSIGGAGCADNNSTTATSSTGGDETRPINATGMICIKY